MSKRSKGPGYDLGQHVADAISNHFNGSVEGFFAAAKHLTEDKKFDTQFAVKAYQTLEEIPWQAQRLADRLLMMDEKEIARKFGDFIPTPLTKQPARPTRVLEDEMLDGLAGAAPA